MPNTPILQLPYPTSADPPDGPAQIQALAEAIEAHGSVYLGEIRYMARNAPPPGWLVPDGRAVSRTTYAKLYAVCADMFGAGDGTTTFNLPTVAGRVLVGSGLGTGLTNRPPGTKLGAEAVGLTAAQNGAHSHGGASGSMNRSNPHAHNLNFELGGAAENGTTGQVITVPVGGTRPGGAIAVDINHEHSIAADGSGTPHENMPPALAVPAYIYAGA